MTAALALLAELRSRGIELETDGARLRWRPAFLVSAPLGALIRSRRGELIELLTGPDCLPRCPACRRPLDSAGRCWRCRDRPCSNCGRPTGSAFLRCCLPCEYAFMGETETGLPS